VQFVDYNPQNACILWILVNKMQRFKLKNALYVSVDSTPLANYSIYEIGEGAFNSARGKSPFVR